MEPAGHVSSVKVCAPHPRWWRLIHLELRMTWHGS